MMVNYCDFEECGEKSKYGVKQSKVSRCKDHKEEGMVTHSGEYCKHNRRQQRCKQCKGVSICEHNKIRSQCKDCKGSQICEHNRERGRCKQCKGSQICEHNRERGNCKQCKGSQICEHNKRRIYCKKCKGSQICKHNRRREKCWQCNPESNYFCIRRYDNGTRCIKEKRAKSKYDNYCTTCFVELFPEDDRSKTAFLAREELNTKRYLDTEFSGTFIYNRQLFIANKDNTCTPHRRFIDFQTTIGTYVFCIEVDENQHKNYDPIDEEERIMQIYENANRKLIFIRFNPDNYIRNGITKKTLLKDRFQILGDKIREVIDRIEHGDGYDKWFTEIKLFFDDCEITKKSRKTITVKTNRSNPSVQCEGTTIKGNKCKRKTKRGNYCNYHQKIENSS